ncbi:hypothetical protein B0T25DRAFT_267315 [Lasiosphaeria hispida]|uniref:Uncharacterized protein n=1 Tax=Lasiosphaeria hispida TaxID=260671 RepID=A0AAJ0HB13_9PEZI|nr:hypothetical protein B0T25DRAFT_267315 [Lasiosphaeria hispida]
METEAVLASLPQPASFQQAIQQWRNAPAPAHPALSRARSYECALGDVILTSGLSRTSKEGSHALDFALISVDAAHVPKLEAMTNDPCLSAIKAVSANARLFLEAGAETLVVKTGAATGTTLGKAAGFATIRMLVELPNGNTVPIESRELVILNHSQDAPFSTNGDSGAVVRNAEGHMVSMLWGGLEPGSKNANMDGSPVILMNPPERWLLDLKGVTFVTPIKVLLDEIQDEFRKLAGDIPVTLHPLAMSSGPSISTMSVGPEDTDG